MPRREQQTMNDLAYVSHAGLLCPYCHAEAVTRTRPEPVADPTVLIQFTRCHACGRAWHGYFKLAGWWRKEDHPQMSSTREHSDLSRKAIPVACPCCGSDRVAQIDRLEGFAIIQAVYPDGTIVWSGDTRIDWDSQQPAHDPPEHLCLHCGAAINLRQLIRRATGRKRR